MAPWTSRERLALTASKTRFDGRISGAVCPGRSPPANCPDGQGPVVQRFGIYAIYYAGDSELCTPISGSFEIPIYSGKPDPDGGRKGVEVAEAWEGTPLWKRISTHRRKLGAAADFELKGFYVRYLPADDLVHADGRALDDQRTPARLTRDTRGLRRDPPGRAPPGRTDAAKVA
ncbi:Eco29kI family restriction endonuclease [Streptomyces sp. NBC_01335]|uniref:Eco29kI family restriction endonuclease n=1 Tax=Streptomyces sp. NBC_01335 TaxID=2903828 RepID=UPI003FA3C850